MLEINLGMEEQIKYYECSDFPFNFKLKSALRTGDPVEATDITGAIDTWMDNLPVGRAANWLVKTVHATLTIICILCLCECDHSQLTIVHF